ncbi:10084_t:CDS:2 [Gigaspora margarita]|uniref:10084_t:CDS:1 n=1 Tax=Gigaspora margarita TaxID=4874 RepID=A0ABN7VMD2_GIGMA|nr:10084_t:CDS:2 [Gigaspora margarita]
MTGSHLPSMLEICKILMDRGYNVTLVAPGNYTAQSFSYKSIPQIRFDPKEMVVHNITVTSYLPLYNIYKKTAKEINADLFFCDHSLNHPCYDLAWKLGKPAVGITSSLIGTIIAIQSCRQRKITLTINDINAQRAKVGVDPHWNYGGRISNILMLLDNFFGFEEIGPILPDIYPSLTHNTSKHCGYSKSFLELIDQDVIDGVIWATVKTDTSELLSLNNSNIPMSVILNKNHPHIHITKYAPQFAILSHENTKLFLSHGGVSSCLESMYNARPMLILPIMGDQPGNAEKLKMAGMALSLSKTNLDVNDIVAKVKRLLDEKSFKKNAERLQLLAKVNSKRKYRGADLIKVVLNTAKHEGIEEENGGFKIDNEILLRDWITPDSRMGYIRGKYLDVYSVAFTLSLALSGGFVYALFKIINLIYRRNKNSQRSIKSKRE